MRYSEVTIDPGDNMFKQLSFCLQRSYADYLIYVFKSNIYFLQKHLQEDIVKKI